LFRAIEARRRTTAPGAEAPAAPPVSYGTPASKSAFDPPRSAEAELINFDAETVAAMILAFNRVLESLKLDRSSPAAAQLAQKILDCVTG
jgi:hypothetical protein